MGGIMSLAGVAKSLIRSHGSKVNIFKKGNKTNMPDFTVQALKNSKKESKAVVFQFPDSQNIEVGDVINQVGARDRWVVTEIEDIIIQNNYSHFEVIVDKEGARAKDSIAPTNVIYNLHGANPRINQNSTDNSVNINIENSSDLIQLVSDLRTEIKNLKLEKSVEIEALEVVDVIQSQITSEKPNKTVLSSMITGLKNLLPHAANIATVGSAILDNLP
jgi:hypothetical protein